jgi:hypothetical protein
MPIRFACPHCRQKLSVSSRKAGQTADCPRCKRTLEIPSPSEPTAPVAAAVAVAPAEADAVPETEAIAQAADAEAGPAAFPSFVMHDSPELVYDTSDDPTAADRRDEPADLIAVPRWILYLQGGLIAVVALTSFLLGAIAGSAVAPGSAGPREPQACLIEGTINYAAGNRNLADEGAVIAIIPQNQEKPDEKAPAIGLRPEDTTPGENDRGVAILRQLGGGYARTDTRGRFQVRLPDRGKYLVLVISRARQLQSLDEISTEDLLKLGPYFDNAADLLGRQRYQLTQQVVRGDQRVNVVFD